MKAASVALRPSIDCSSLQKMKMTFILDTLFRDPLVHSAYTTLYLEDGEDVPMAFNELPAGYAETISRGESDSGEFDVKAAMHKIQTDRHVIQLEPDLTFEEHQQLWMLMEKELRKTFLNPDLHVRPPFPQPTPLASVARTDRSHKMQNKFVPRTSGTGGEHCLFHFSLRKRHFNGRTSRCADLAFEYPAGCDPKAMFERLCELDDRFVTLNAEGTDDEGFPGVKIFDDEFSDAALHR